MTESDRHHHLFSNGAKAYSAFRPDYPQELYETIFRFADLTPQETLESGLAVDVATGQGQAALQLSKHFSSVIALDANPNQLAHVPSHAPNVQFKCADAHATDLPNGCADLVTAASALHWFDIPRFYREVRRVLKPSGSMAAWAIPLGLGTISTPLAPEAAAAATAALHRLHTVELGPYWSKKRECVENMYRGVEPGPQDFGHVELQQLTMVRELSVEQLVGYVSSWSSYSSFLAANLNPELDPVQEFGKALLQALQTEDPSVKLLVHIPLALVIAKEPRPLEPEPPALEPSWELSCPSRDVQRPDDGDVKGGMLDRMCAGPN